MKVHLNKVRYKIPFKNYLEVNANVDGSWKLGLQGGLPYGKSFRRKAVPC